MGEIADLILNGVIDQYTGEYLGEPVGYPRSRIKSENGNINAYPDEGKKYGIYKYFGCQKITKKQRREILISFYPDVPGKENLSNLNLCVYASENFKEFTKYVEAWKAENKAI